MCAAERATASSESARVTLPAYCMLALTVIGIAVAVYGARGNHTGQQLWCPIIDGCNAVVNSPYSRVFGVPMSYFGFICYFIESDARHTAERVVTWRRVEVWTVMSDNVIGQALAGSAK
jgi:uncharacterized membrane protein